MRAVAVDWSGRAVGAARATWVAEAVEGELVFLENHRGAAEVAGLLAGWADREADLVVGLDFAFSFPAWFPRERGLDSAPALWALAAREGEEWLAGCRPPFWGRPGRPRPDLGGRAHLRRTEREVPAVAGVRPKSAFQVGGAGAVGTGSIRGMKVLAALADAGFTIWPFTAPGHPVGLPAVVEIYPRLLTGPVRKSSPEAREAYLDGAGPIGSAAFRALAASSEDAFDAAVSALAMWRHRDELARLAAPLDEVARLEGAIWQPNGLPAGSG